MTNTIGERIKYLRQLAEISQEELGNRVGVQRAAINKYEKGSVTNIPIATIEKIALIFNVSPTYIVGWDSESSNPLSAEVKIIQGIKRFYGADTVELIELYSQLNSLGKKRVFQYAEDMSVLHSKVGDADDPVRRH
jgi:transcriptional regulator with XRE-family HTH domain